MYCKRTVGIIVEYNPFHNGHDLHLKYVKEKYPNHAVIAVMSGHFTQRGEPALVDKWQRADFALSAGVDLVIELPFFFATQSADYFAKGAMMILNMLAVEVLIFGSETADLERLTQTAKDQLIDDKTDVHTQLKKGFSYPHVFNQMNIPLKSNDILGVAYLKQKLIHHYSMSIDLLKRTNNYHDQALNHIASASAIRNAIRNNQSIDHTTKMASILKDQCVSLIEKYYPFMRYQLLVSNPSDLSQYRLVDEGIENHLKKIALKAAAWEEFIEQAVTKRYTKARIQRTLTQIFIKHQRQMITDEQISYLRILACNQVGQAYLNSIKKQLVVPLITSYKKDLSAMLDLELQSTIAYAISFSPDFGNQLIAKEFNFNPFKKS